MLLLLLSIFYTKEIQNEREWRIIRRKQQAKKDQEELSTSVVVSWEKIWEEELKRRWRGRKRREYYMKCVRFYNFSDFSVSKWNSKKENKVEYI